MQSRGARASISATLAFPCSLFACSGCVACASLQVDAVFILPPSTPPLPPPPPPPPSLFRVLYHHFPFHTRTRFAFIDLYLLHTASYPTPSFNASVPSSQFSPHVAYPSPNGQPTSLIHTLHPLRSRVTANRVVLCTWVLAAERARPAPYI